MKSKLLFLIFGLWFLVFCSPVWAANQRSLNFGVAASKVTTTPSPTVTPKPVNYPLVYPGILPDHFLYPLKMIRDRIWLILTAGPVRKVEVMLLFADKRLGAGKALIEGGQVKLGVSTLTKGEKYLEEGVGKLAEARKANQEITSLREKYSLALAKHEEVLLDLKTKVGAEEQAVINELLTKIEQLKKNLE
jgi:hypothetical protein